MADDGPTRVPVASGKPYRVTSPPENALVTRDLASELGKVLERFAAEAGFNERKPVSVFFKPGVVGHHKVGRAADIYAVGGIGIDIWKTCWDQGLQPPFGAMHPEQRRRNAGAERNHNLGWRLYKALQMYGRWAQPYGYPIQLFGPWTRTEGPWQYISDRLLHAHGDHIHVAK
jgi:hypothetical protein